MSQSSSQSSVCCLQCNNELENALKQAGAADSMSSWEHFPHGADIGVRGIGPTLEAAFSGAGRGLTAMMIDPEKVVTQEWINVCCEAPDTETLLRRWLDVLVTEMADRRMLFNAFHVHMENGHLRARVGGETVDYDRHVPGVEVKGSTNGSLRVLEDGDQWLAQCAVAQRRGVLGPGNGNRKRW